MTDSKSDKTNLLRHLADKRIFSITPIEKDFLVGEECDNHFGVRLTRDEMRQLAAEILEITSLKVQDQSEWFSLVDKLGEATARHTLASKLRWAADQVEDANTMPDVFGCHLVDGGSFPIIVSVTLSYPWGG